jgi:phospholipid N-methyltransferase
MDRSEAEQIYPAQFRQFFCSWILNPLTVGAVAPSSRTLAKLMVSGMHSGARVMELGAGTGMVTRAILDRGVAQSDLHLVERNASFARLLKQRFPQAILLEEDATSLVDSTRELRGSFDFIVSGLPLVLFSRAQKHRMLEHSFDLLKPTGAFHQFTYGGRCPIRRHTLEGLDVSASLIGIAPFNVPPAFVYRLHRRH